MRNLTLALTTLLGALLSACAVAVAAGPAEKYEGFSGRICAGAGYMTNTSRKETRIEF